jgi:hypothetical protein
MGSAFGEPRGASLISPPPGLPHEGPWREVADCTPRTMETEPSRYPRNMSQTAAQIVTSTSRLRRLSDEAAWQLIRAQNAHVILAILRSNFVESSETRVPAPILFERIDDDVVALRNAGYDLPQTAQQYCSAWLSQGYLERRPGEIGGDETYELSSEALTAIGIVSDLETPPKAATESRLTTVMSQLDQLVVDTDEDVASRVEALQRERDRLDARIAAIRNGRSGTIDDRVALERVRDILSLADQLPADFARVRREIERLNVRFRKDIIENDGGRGDVLEALFRGVDVLAEQEAGRSFQAFYALLTDLERSSGLDAAIETVLSRPFVRELTTAQQDFLRDLVPSLSQRGGEVHEVYVSLSRSLRSFVQRREYEEERTVSRLLTIAQRRFGVISETVPVHRSSGFELGLSQSELSSVGQWTPFSDDGERPASLVENVAHEIDLARILAVIRESEIDLRELQRNVASALEHATVVSIADVLARHPATQGFGSVVGLVYIALQRRDSSTAIQIDGQTETVQWNSDPARFAKVPRLLFTTTGHSDEQ